MMRCSPLYGKNKRIKESKKKVRRGEKLNKEVIRELVPKRFWR